MPNCPSSSALAIVNQLLERFARFGVELGLTSTQTLLAHLDNPQTQVPIIHVAGTNGKGSVCAYLSSILTHSGYRVGRYTSPHLIDWTERICIDGQPILSQSLLEILQQVQAAIAQHSLHATQFEVITAAAWLYFSQQKVDIAIMEVGLGGRLDATNVCDRPLATIITSISRDHWERLGDTLGAIATEKAGILKPHCPAFIGPLPPDAEAVVKGRTMQLDCPTTWVTPATRLPNGTLDYHWPVPANPTSNIQNPKSPFSYTVPLPGVPQQINSALAIATLHYLQDQGWKITDNDIRLGLAQTQWPGRLQWMTLNGHRVLMDGAHNEASAIALRHYVDHYSNRLSPPEWPGEWPGEYPGECSGAFPRSVHWVMGMLSTKDHTAIFKALLRSGDRLSLVPIAGHPFHPLDELADLAQHCCPTLQTCDRAGDAITVLDHLTQDPNSIKDSVTIVLCGSLYLLGEVLGKLP